MILFKCWGIFNNIIAALLLLILAIAGSLILFWKNIKLAYHGFEVDLENNAATDSGREFEENNGK